MALLDWIIFIVPIIILAIIVCHTQKYVKTVADFLAGGRTAGRYLLTSANGMAGMGLISLVCYTQNFYHSGWALQWWSNGTVIVSTILTLSGFVFYRYRQTRAMTLAQFFEMRYSRNYRIMMGTICWISGIVNFGIFPAIGANFFIAFLNLPLTIGPFQTYPLLMGIFLGMACLITMLGGQIQNMVTDTIQALFTYAIGVIVAIVMLIIFTPAEMKEALLSQPPGKSYINPFDTADISDFNFYFFLMNLFFLITQYGAWQGNQGYAASARNPHEAKMGNILGTWRSLSMGFFSIVFALGGLVIFFTSKYQAQAAELLERLGGNFSPAVVDQLAMPIGVMEMLPAGIKGMVALVLFFFMLSTDTTYIHSWGSILIQDVILPVYGKKVSLKTHMLLLRLSMLFVAVFALCFSWFYQQSEYINMFQIITGAIFSAAAGGVIIGGLYWKKGTKAGAWACTMVGVSLSLFMVVLLDVRGWQWFREVLLNFFPGNETLLNATDKCPLHGGYLALFVSLAAQFTYIAVSLLTCKKPFNMDKLLHRGAYADGETSELNHNKIAWYKRLFLGFDEEFTRNDKIISLSVSIWTAVWGAAFIIITLWNILGYLLPDSILKMWPAEWWFYYLAVFVASRLLLGPITAVWIGYGCVKDLKIMFRLLRENKHSDDDGYVEEIQK